MANNPNISPNELEAPIDAYIKGKPILPYTDFAYAFVVRSSPNTLSPGEVFKSISRCSFPPDPEKIRIQRCNYDKQQVFYAAVTADTETIKAADTAMMETCFNLIKSD